MELVIAERVMVCLDRRQRPPDRELARRRFGRRLSVPQLQVLRNQSVGRTWSGAASGPRFVAVTRMKMIVRIGLGVFDRDIEKAVLAQDAGVPEFEFGLAS